MDPAKQPALEAAYRRIATVAESLCLTAEELAEVEARVKALRSRSTSELRRVATMVEGRREATKEAPSQ